MTTTSDPARGGDRKTPLLLAALGYARRGMAVFPCLVGHKVPLWTAWETRATRDPDEIVRVWGRAPYNVGVACGPSGIVVVDLDVPKESAVAPAEWRQIGVATGVEVLSPSPCRRASRSPSR